MLRNRLIVGISKGRVFIYSLMGKYLGGLTLSTT